MGHSFDMLTFDFLLKPPQPVTGLFLTIDILYITGNLDIFLTFDFLLKPPQFGTALFFTCLKCKFTLSRH